MKRFFQTVAIAAFVAALALLLSACAGPSIDLQSVADDLEIVAQEATAFVVSDHPADRVKFEQAVYGLRSIEASGTVTADSIVLALQAAGIDELDSREARLSIAGGRLVFHSYVRRNSKTIDQNFLPVAIALRRGIEKGLK
jgi:hypothetical protein